MSLPNGASDENHVGVAEPIAICGMGMRLPGGVRDAESFWTLLCTKASGRCLVPKDRYNVEAFYGPGKVGHVASRYGYFLDDIKLSDADASFWSMTKEEVAGMDPQQRLVLEVVYEAFQTAGRRPSELRGRRVGVYVGSFEGDWQEMDGRDAQSHHLYRLTGYGDYMPASRISREFGLMGPSVTARTACSSSLTALHDACLALRDGACEAAVVACASVVSSPRTTAALHEQGVLSPTGACRAFDAGADGYARGEAASAVLVRRLRDAVRDGDPVRSVVRATALNANGATSSTIVAPSTEAIEALVRRGYALAGISDFSTTAMVECHGTGTAVGDTVEVQAVANIFGTHGVHIGSVKPNLGHSEGASGLSSVIKMTLALENQTIPPNINFKTPSPKSKAMDFHQTRRTDVQRLAVPFERYKLTVPVEPQPWPSDRDQLVVVNSFGIGGSNAVALLSSVEACRAFTPCAPAADLTAEIDTEESQPLVSRLMLFSAKHPAALQRSIQDHEAYLIRHPGRLRDMSYSLAARREHMAYRGFCVTDGLDDWAPVHSRRPILPGKCSPPKVVFTFTGQGAQWAGMGRSLMRSAAAFREQIQTLDAFLHALPDGPKWSLMGKYSLGHSHDELEATGTRSRLSEAELSQPCCTALQVALVALLSQYGIRPDAVVGHSSGEIAAGFASGMITADEAILAAYYRGRAVARLDQTSRPGAMAAVGLGPEAVVPYLLPGVVVGCENSLESTTVTGDLEPIEAVCQAIREARPEVSVRKLKVDRAYHSHHMEAVAEAYSELMANKISPKTAEVPFFSSVSGEIISKGNHRQLGTEYWVRNLVCPVRFSTAVAQAIDTMSGKKIFLEIGPHAALAGPLRQILHRLGSQDDEYICTLIRGNDSHEDMLRTAGNLWLHGLQPNYEGITGRGRFLVDLPLYPWHYEEPLWRESRLSRDYRLRPFAHHDLLGSRVIETTDEGPAWRNILRPELLDWVLEYQVKEDHILPAAGFVCMAGEAVRQLPAPVSSCGDFTVRRLHVPLETALVLQPGQQVEVITQLWRGAGVAKASWYDFFVSSLDASGTWVKHAYGQVRTGRGRKPTSSRKAPDAARLPRLTSREDWYGRLRTKGLSHGQHFARLADMRTSTDERERRAVARATSVVRPGESAYAIHPTTLDCVFQTVPLASANGLTRRLRRAAVPTYVGEVYIRPPVQPEMTVAGRCHERVETNSPLSGTAVAVCDGEVVAAVTNLQLTDVEAGRGADEGDGRTAAAALVWREDVDLLDASRLLRVAEDRTDLHGLLDRFATACVAEAAGRARSTTPARPHLARYADWLQALAGDLRQGRHGGGGGPSGAGVDAPEEEDGTRPGRLGVLHDLHAALLRTAAAPAAEAIWRVATSCASILDGTTDVLDLLFEGGVLPRLYDFMSNSDCSALLGLLAHRKPDLSVLEIGAGTGGTTAAVLPALRFGGGGERMYHTYVYTDVSPGFFRKARERFSEYEGVEFAVLDISRCPLVQGFQPESFDLIIACNVLHATPSLKETLINVRKLLRPRGRLFLQELSPATKWINFVAGVLPGWWLGQDDSRLLEPYVCAERWNQELVSAGFAGIDCLAYDGYLNNNIIARPAMPSTRARRVTMLLAGQEARNGEVPSVVRHLERAGYRVDMFPLERISSTPSPPNQDVVCALDLDSRHPFFSSLDEKTLGSWQRFVAGMCESNIGMLWLTNACHMNCVNPEYGMVLGTAALLRSEAGLEFATVEMDRLDEPSLRWLPRILDEFQRRGPREANAQRDVGWAIVDGRALVGRYHPVDVGRELRGQEAHRTPGETLSVPSPATVRPPPRVRGDRGHLLVGGDLGGRCGRAVATWLVERGARTLVFLSGPEDAGTTGHDLCAELESMGCRTARVPGDASRYADVARAIRSVDAPFASVFVLPASGGASKEATSVHETSSWSDWHDTTRSEIDGIWNLHDAFQREQPEPLETFLLFTSATITTGRGSRTGEAETDAFRDAFVSYRLSRGLRASCLDVGALDHDQAGACFVSLEAKLLDCLGMLMTPNAQRTHIALLGGGRGGHPDTTTPPDDARFLVWNNFQERDEPGPSVSPAPPCPGILDQLLDRTWSGMDLRDSADTSIWLAREIGLALFGLMMRPEPREDVGLDEPLAALGIDSLIGLELRNWMRRALMVEMAVDDIVEAKDIRELGVMAHGKLVERLEEKKLLHRS